MSCLEATFTLTPLSPVYWAGSSPTSPLANDHAELSCSGADFEYFNPTNLESLHASNRFFFADAFASDPNLDYAQWTNRRKSRFLTCNLDLRDRTPKKQLALIFGFDVVYIDSRVLVYTDAGLLQDVTLVYGDNQFLLEIDSLDLPLTLYFVHAGGNWFFRGISGYVV